MPAIHDVQHRLNQWLTAPGTVLIFAFGAYLATKRDYWGEPWVLVPLGILLVIAVVGGGYVVPVPDGSRTWPAPTLILHRSADRSPGAPTTTGFTEGTWQSRFCWAYWC